MTFPVPSPSLPAGADTPCSLRSTEDAHASRSDQEPDDDERDAGEDTASNQRDDPGDHQHHRDDPQDRGHTAAARPGQQSNHRFSSFSVMPTPLVMTFEQTHPTDIARAARPRA